MITAIETTATVGKNRQLLLDEDLPGHVSDRVRVIVLFAKDDLNEADWLKAASQNDALDFLNDEEEVYSLQDGQPLTNEA